MTISIFPSELYHLPNCLGCCTSLQQAQFDWIPRTSAILYLLIESLSGSDSVRVHGGANPGRGWSLRTRRWLPERSTWDLYQTQRTLHRRRGTDRSPQNRQATVRRPRIRSPRYRHTRQGSLRRHLSGEMIRCSRTGSDLYPVLLLQPTCKLFQRQCCCSLLFLFRCCCWRKYARFWHSAELFINPRDLDERIKLTALFLSKKILFHWFSGTSNRLEPAAQIALWLEFIGVSPTNWHLEHLLTGVSHPGRRRGDAHYQAWRAWLDVRWEPYRL